MPPYDKSEGRDITTAISIDDSSGSEPEMRYVPKKKTLVQSAQSSASSSGKSKSAPSSSASPVAARADGLSANASSSTPKMSFVPSDDSSDDELPLISTSSSKVRGKAPFKPSTSATNDAISNRSSSSSKAGSAPAPPAPVPAAPASLAPERDVPELAPPAPAAAAAGVGMQQPSLNRYFRPSDNAVASGSGSTGAAAGSAVGGMQEDLVDAVTLLVRLRVPHAPVDNFGGPRPPAQPGIWIDGEFVQVEAADNNDEPVQPQLQQGAEITGLLNSMAQGQYHGDDALGSLFGDSASFDVANLPLYASTDDLAERGLRTPLHRHQLQGLRWMVNHEHPKMPQKKTDAPVMLYQARNARGGVYWWHLALRQATRKPQPLPRGGILADGMGLGKTLQIIALILSNATGEGAETEPEVDSEDEKPKLPGRGVVLKKGKMRTPRKSWRKTKSDSEESSTVGDESDELESKHEDFDYDEDEEIDIYDESKWSKTTLVVAPLSITTQWLQQIEQHTEGLRTVIYHGAQMTKNTEFSRYDVVITTYDTIRGQHKVIADRRLKAARLAQYNEAVEGLQQNIDKYQRYLNEPSIPDEARTGYEANLNALLWAKEQEENDYQSFLKDGDKGKGKKRARSQGKGKAKKRARNNRTASTSRGDDSSSESDNFVVNDSEVEFENDSEDYGASSSKKKQAAAKFNPLFTTPFRRIVLDEAHTIRNPKTALYQGILDLKCQRRWSLTGTPIVNGTRDLESLAKWHGLLPFADDPKYWTQLIQTPIRRGERKGSNMLTAVVRALTLRRVKSMTDEKGRSLVDLPTIEVLQHVVPLLTKDREYYDACERAFRERIETWLVDGTLTEQRGIFLVLIMRLRQLCCHRSLISPEFLEILKTRDFSAGGGAVGADLDQVSIEALQEKLAAFVAAGDDCPVCLTALLNKEPVITPCSHAFCRECIQQVMNTSARCPLDRRPLPPGSKLIALPVANDDPDADGAEDIKPEDVSSDSGSAKLNEIVRIIHALEQRDPTEKILVFSNFTSFLNLVSAKLREEDIPHCRYDGSMSIARRDRSLASFNRPIRTKHQRNNNAGSSKASQPSKSITELIKNLEKDRQAATGSKSAKHRAQDHAERDGVGKTIPRVMLLTLGAGSLGLNLVAASVVIICDPWWQSAVEQQAVDRIHRIGQRRNCLVFHFTAENTIETRMQEIQARKENLTTTAFNGYTAHGRRIVEARSRRDTNMGDLATVLGLPSDVVARVIAAGSRN